MGIGFLMSALLAATILMPAMGALLARGDAPQARRSALVTSLFVLAMAAVLIYQYPVGAADFAVTDQRRSHSA